jgi:hypothetical protein
MTYLLGSADIEALSREDSVRGVLVRMVMEQAEDADSEEVALLEKALQMLLTRFKVMEDNAS